MSTQKAGFQISSSSLITQASGIAGGKGGKPPRNSEVLTKLSRIPSAVENTSVTT
jgi:hypothetical protein